MANFSIPSKFLGFIDPTRCFNKGAEMLVSSFHYALLDPYPVVTLVGAVLLTAKLAISFFKHEGKLRSIDVVIVLASWAGYHSAKTNAPSLEMLNRASEEIRAQLDAQRRQLEEEKRLLQTQKEEFERLRKSTESLAQTAPALEEAATAHFQANQVHASLITDERDQLAQEKQELARIEEGFFKLRELEEEIQAAESDKKQIKEEISTLLEEQRKMNRALAEKIDQLKQIESQLKRIGNSKK